jgi:hypothetical protein
MHPSYFFRQARLGFSKAIRTAIEPPVSTISPELNRTPPTYRSTGDPTARDNRIRLPGARERISRTDIVHRPNSASTPNESEEKRSRFSAAIKMIFYFASTMD